MVKVERTYPAPASLEKEKAKRNGSYREKDVIDKLKSDFNGKCYICNMGELADIEVEHLNPHKNGANLDLKFDWNNLFLSCPHCNSIKNDRKYHYNIIDCCVVDPERYLKFYIDSNIARVDSRENEDEKACMTAELINEVFNKDNTGIRRNGAEQRTKKLLTEMNLFYTSLRKYKTDTSNNRNKRVLRGMLKRESVFAAFKRDYIRRNIELYSEFKDWVL